MAKPRRGVPESVSRGWVKVVMAVLCAAGGISGGSVWALWSDAHAVSALSLDQASFGFSVAKADDPADVASALGDSVQFTLGSAEAAELVEQTPDEGVFWLAIPFTVTMLTSAGYGMDYTLTATDPQTDTVLATNGATPFYFQVDSLEDCTAEVAKTKQGAGQYTLNSTITGIPSGVNPRQVHADLWCAAMAITPDIYSAPATASGDGGIPATSVDDDTWWVYVTENPANEPVNNVTVTLTALLQETECES